VQGLRLKITRAGPLCSSRAGQPNGRGRLADDSFCAMSLATLRLEVLQANQDLAKRGLAPFTFGNVSAIDRATGLVVIKPSGMSYDTMTVDDLVATDLDGNIKEGTRRPSSDLATHLVLYRAFEGIGAVAHSHSHFATSWAQAGREIPCLGTTHADYFFGSVPVTDELRPKEIESDYEANTGHVIVRRFKGMDPMHMPAVLVHGHAPFTWATSAGAAVETMAVLEEVARLACHTQIIATGAPSISDALRDKHFFRKHGAKAYYGQR
jgi:L-ribulose-5-phosphate 4-epimerase